MLVCQGWPTLSFCNRHTRKHASCQGITDRGIEETQPNKPTTLKGIIMTSNTLDTPKVSAGFDINAHFRKLMHELGLTPEDTGGSITFVGKDPACRYQPQRV
jgi:hypothetical protein